MNWWINININELISEVRKNGWVLKLNFYILLLELIINKLNDEILEEKMLPRGWRIMASLWGGGEEWCSTYIIHS